MRRYLLFFALALGLPPLAQQLLAAAIQPDDVVSPLVVMPLISPDPVLGADGKVHLAYEIVLVNMAPGEILHGLTTPDLTSTRHHLGADHPTPPRRSTQP